MEPIKVNPIPGQPLAGQPIVRQTPNQPALEETQREQQANQATRAPLVQPDQTVKSTIPASAAAAKGKIYYARLDGTTHILTNGHICRFENGQYATNKASEQAELNALCELEGQYMITNYPVPCQKSKANIMREVGSGVVSGVVNSGHIIGLEVQ